MQSESSPDEIDGWAGSVDGGTFFASWDGRDSDGLSPEGAIPPGDDLVEADLRRLFSIESEESMLQGSEMDDLQVLRACVHPPFPCRPHADLSFACATHDGPWISLKRALAFLFFVCVQLMFKLRKELGDNDFKRIFEDPRVKGLDLT
jgi:hypothetical protein